MPRLNPLERYFEAHKGRRIHKWMHYFDIYDRHFSKFRGRPVVVLEFGVQYGGSAQMWREYFGPDAKIYGVDIDPRCQHWEEPGSRSSSATSRTARSCAGSPPRWGRSTW